jgi:hypothetical protein
MIDCDRRTLSPNAIGFPPTGSLPAQSGFLTQVAESNGEPKLSLSGLLGSSTKAQLDMRIRGGDNRQRSTPDWYPYTIYSFSQSGGTFSVIRLSLGAAIGLPQPCTAGTTADIMTYLVSVDDESRE